MISVIIPTLNEVQIIESALRDLMTRNGEFEVIVVDGGSRDGTVEIARRYARVLSSPAGRAIQMNRGAAAARGETLLFLHADCRLPANAFSAIETVLTQDGIVGGGFTVTFDEDHLKLKVIALGGRIRQRLTGVIYGDQGMFVRRDLFKWLGGFKEIPLMEDVVFSKRLKQVGRIAFLEEQIRTSGRRFLQEGAMKSIFRIFLFNLLYRFKVHPKRLANHYGDVR
ncbi:MAG: TIGR04283 family arsenosugar biosynthesis glycosyltransferase [Candidatus Bipolaricaulia bacterium]